MYEVCQYLVVLVCLEYIKGIFVHERRQLICNIFENISANNPMPTTIITEFSSINTTILLLFVNQFSCF